MPKGKTTTAKCNICNRDVSLFAYNRHIKAHLTNENFLKKKIFAQGSCEFCQKIYFNKSGLSNHLRRCPKNPNRIMETLTDSGRAKISKSSTRFNETRWANFANIERQRESMRKAAENYPESYNHGHPGRGVKRYVVDGITLTGKWEVDFYIWARDNGLNPKRPEKGFKYEYDGVRTYYPDFYIESLDLYVEVKGWESERDHAKWLQFPKKLIIIRQQEIKQIRENTFKGL